SLGVTLYQLLTGQAPFVGDNAPAIFAAIAADTPPRIDALRPGIPAALADAVARALEKDPRLRFQTMEELADALRPFASFDGVLVGGGTPSQRRARADRSLETTLVAEHSPRALSTPAPVATEQPARARTLVPVGVGIAAV